MIFFGGHLIFLLFYGFYCNKICIIFIFFNENLHIHLGVPEITGILGAVHQSRYEYIWGCRANAWAEPNYAKKFRLPPPLMGIDASWMATLSEKS